MLELFILSILLMDVVQFLWINELMNKDYLFKEPVYSFGHSSERGLVIHCFSKRCGSLGQLAGLHHPRKVSQSCL